MRWGWELMNVVLALLALAAFVGGAGAYLWCESLARKDRERRGQVWRKDGSGGGGFGDGGGGCGGGGCGGGGG